MKGKASGPTIMSQNDELVLLNVQAVTGSGLQDWSQSGIAAVHWGETGVLATGNSDGKWPELSLVAHSVQVLPEPIPRNAKTSNCSRYC